MNKRHTHTHTHTHTYAYALTSTHSQTHTNTQTESNDSLQYPLTEEFTLKIFGSQDRSVCPIDLLSDGDSVYSTETVFRILGTPVKT